jgi:hypothetical protein
MENAVMTSEFDSSGFAFEKILKSHADDELLPVLQGEAERYSDQGEPPIEVATRRTRVDAYQLYRRRIIAFSRVIYPSIVTENFRSSHLSIGMIYADRLFTRGWARRRVGGFKTRALRYGVEERINLEGSIAIASEPEAALASYVDARFYEEDSDYWHALPAYGLDDDDKSTFMLGVGLVCQEAQRVEACELNGAEHELALQSMRTSMRALSE